MILADTSVWIDYLRARPEVFTRMRLLLENREIISVEWVFGELLQGALNRRERRSISYYWENIPKVPSEGIWIEAGRYSGERKLVSRGVGLIDVAILVAARRAKAKIWTLDGKLRSISSREERFY